MAVKVFIDGAAGTTGLELRERLQSRGELSLVALDEKRRKDGGPRQRAQRCRYGHSLPARRGGKR